MEVMAENQQATAAAAIEVGELRKMMMSEKCDIGGVFISRSLPSP